MSDAAAAVVAYLLVLATMLALIGCLRAATTVAFTALCVLVWTTPADDGR